MSSLALTRRPASCFASYCPSYKTYGDILTSDCGGARATSGSGGSSNNNGPNGNDASDTTGSSGDGPEQTGQPIPQNAGGAAPSTGSMAGAVAGAAAIAVGVAAVML
jgi:hypothetical protein